MEAPTSLESAQGSNSSSDLRKFIILFLIFFWLIGFLVLMWRQQEIRTFYFYVFIGLAIIYLVDIVYSIVLTAQENEFIKPFMLQSAVPIVALIVVTVLAYNQAIDSVTTLSLFALSLATYIIGKRMNPEDKNTIKRN